MTREAADPDPLETQEWLDAIEDVVDRDGGARAHRLLDAAVGRARAMGVNLPFSATTAYRNTIPVENEPPFPGDAAMELRIRRLNRWNAMAMVVRRNRESSEFGGHIASYASSAVLYDVGLNHFWRIRGPEHGGDLVFFQGHAVPGIYARAFMEGRIDLETLDNFRAETGGKGLSSYPHPWLMPEFWQFPTVSMGLGPLMAIYQARFMRYLENRGLLDAGDRKVWAFLGDGEMDEPESLGAISIAAREGLDNLIFVVNCNLQRLDGPVRGNGKIIQELEGLFRGAGWNVIKLIWGDRWDPLLERDTSGRLAQLMEETLDGDYQAYKSRGGAYTRKNFFERYPETAALVADMSDNDIWRLQRGGHDPGKVHAAYRAAVDTKGQPTVILAKTVKGYGMGEAGEGQNITHQQKKMAEDKLRAFRDRFDIPVADADVKDAPYVVPTPEQRAYLLERRARLGGAFPVRHSEVARKLVVPELDAFAPLLEASGERRISTTMAFVRALNILCRDKQVGSRVVPIVPDESRTFGMEGMFRQLGIYNPKGQLYKPEDADQLMYYKESESGQVLEEGINEAGAMADWIAAATSYSVHGLPMIPFFIFYSMFGFQRIGDLIWAAGDSRSRGFLIGGTSGRTTLNGEGLQHQDGHSHLLASTVPNCISYDPTFAFELAVILASGLQRMFVDEEDVFFYLTTMNENYLHPARPEGVDEGILRGLYRLEAVETPGPRHVNLMGSGTILVQALAARDLLAERFDVTTDIWSATSMNELARDGQDAARQARLDPFSPAPVPWVTKVLGEAVGPVVAATDYVKSYAEQIRAFVPLPFHTLGTDGFGRSDSRRALRHHFEVDAPHIAAAALVALLRQGVLEEDEVRKGLAALGIDAGKANPRTA